MQDMRTSEGTFLSAADDHDGVLHWLEEKIAAVTLLPVHHGEVGRACCSCFVSQHAHSILQGCAMSLQQGSSQAARTPRHFAVHRNPAHTPL